MRVQNRRGQLSFEALSVFSMVMFGLVIATLFFATETVHVVNEREFDTLQQFAGIIRSEFQLAITAEPGYARRFHIPERIRDRDIVLDVLMPDNPREDFVEVSVRFDTEESGRPTIYEILGRDVYGTLNFGENTLIRRDYGLLVYPENLPELARRHPNITDVRIRPNDVTLHDTIQCSFDIVDIDQSADIVELTWKYQKQGSGDIRDIFDDSAQMTVDEWNTAEERLLDLRVVSQDGIAVCQHPQGGAMGPPNQFDSEEECSLFCMTEPNPPAWCGKEGHPNFGLPAEGDLDLEKGDLVFCEMSLLGSEYAHVPNAADSIRISDAPIEIIVLGIEDSTLEHCHDDLSIQRQCQRNFWGLELEILLTDLDESDEEFYGRILRHGHNAEHIICAEPDACGSLVEMTHGEPETFVLLYNRSGVNPEFCHHFDRATIKFVANMTEASDEWPDQRSMQTIDLGEYITCGDVQDG